MKSALRIAIRGPLVLVLGIAACTSQTPEERLAALRSHYRAELNGFLVKETPLEPAPEAAVVPPGVLPESDPAPLPTRTDLLLDLVVRHDAPERLPGVTVDVTMVDSAQRPKGRWLVWVDTADLPKATQQQVSHEIQGVDYQEGDGFYAEVRHPIPAAERGDYRELAGVAP
jgi:hypothetical protein